MGFFLKALFRSIILLTILFAVSKWIIVPLCVINLTTQGLIAVVICSVMVLLTVVLPFVFQDKD